MPENHDHEPPKHDPYAAIRLPDYRFFAGGFALSSTGLQMLSTAIGWEIYERTSSELMLGYTGLARALPVVLLALPAGQLADIVSRKWIVVTTQASFSILAAALAWASYTQAPLIVMYLLLALSGVARAFNAPARAALLPQIVPSGAFTNAVAWNSGVFQFSGMLGPVIAGVIIAQWGGAWAVYACTAAMTAIFSLCATAMNPRAVVRTGARMTVGSMLGGLGFVRREKTILGAILIDCLGVMFGGATALLPVFAKDILHVGPVGLGALRAAPFAGAVLTAVIIAHRPPFARVGRTFLLAVCAWAVAIIAFGLSTNVWLSLFLLAFQGAVDNVSVVIRHVLVQFRTPDHLRGRVGAVNSMFIEISNELGAFESGLVAQFLGPVVSVVTGGLATLSVVGAIGAGIPELRRLGQLREHNDPEVVPSVHCRACGQETSEIGVECPECRVLRAGK